MAKGITATQKGDTLVIEIPLNKNPQPSKSGKSFVVASTNGNVALDLKMNGKPVILGLNAYYKSE